MNIYVHKDQKCAMNIGNFRVSTKQWKNHRENYQRGLLLKKIGGFWGVYSIQKSQKGERI